ncbi:MAG: SDR family oxidoreductase [Gemmatimonadales bacterium]|nr:MAG: SDR family oxidoreductase [Gemmatimonadales bacterium]
MELGLDGRVALVAASSKGLGRAVAEELAAEGCNLVLCARSPEPLEAVGRTIAESTGRQVVVLPTDVADARQVEALVELAHRTFGRVDVLVTNGGGPPPGRFEEHGIEAWRAGAAVTLESVVSLIRGVLPGMKERGWGRILNVTSIAVKQPVDGLMLSNSLRAAVTGLARTLANEVAIHGITVNNLMPGYTRTERLEELAEHITASRGISESEAYAAWEDQVPMGRIGEPREFAALAAFLASERASYITGQSIAVDGGWIRSLL